MRNITYRAKKIETGEWVEGNLVWLKNWKDEPNGCFIISHLAYLEYGEFDDTYTVNPDTVGQYTGLTDKNGKKIFEGDIVKFGDMLGIINFGFGCYCVRTNKPDWKCRNNPAIDIIFNEYPNEIEVIGNINDNPELLEVK